MITFQKVRDQAPCADMLYRCILVCSYESDTVPESKMFRKEQFGKLQGENIRDFFS